MNMLNYSTHAIADMVEDARIAARQGRRRDADETERFAADVSRGHKFMLPDNGSLLYDMREAPEGMTITRLPFPVTVMEVPFPTDGPMPAGIQPASKRLILAREGIFDGPGVMFRTTAPDDVPNSIKVEIASWYDADRRWRLQPDGAIVMIGSASVAGAGRGRKPDVRGDLFDDAARFVMTTEPTLPDSVDIICRSMTYAEFVAIAGDDIASEIRIMAEMMTALSCSNVGTEVQSPPPKLNKARLKAGREPFHDVHVLVVGGTVLGEPGRNNSVTGPDGYQVRQHVRRGHVRRLADGRRLWVNSTVVAAGSKHGAAHKTYDVAARR